MSNTFIFHGAGQGLFYSGHLNDYGFNFVYDCGSESSEYVKQIKLPCEKIDFLTISHLHEDHVNGLPYLLRNHNIRKIYIPYFDTYTYRDVFIAYLIANGIYPSSEEFSLILYLYDFDLNDPQNMKYTKKEWSNLEIEKEFIYQEKDVTENVWEFYFLNKQLTTRTLNNLQLKLQQILGDLTIEQYFYSNNGDYKTIAKIFKSIFKNINLTSLILLHWNTNNPHIKTLLTGDAKFDSDLNTTLLSLIESNNLILQIPHHGAKVEWDSIDKNILSKTKYEVISFGLDNKYNHPNNQKINQYINNHNKHKLKYVYEKKSFKYIM